MAYRPRKSSRRGYASRGRSVRRAAPRSRRASPRRRATSRRSGSRELRIVVQAAPAATEMATAGSVRVAAKRSQSTF